MFFLALPSIAAAELILQRAAHWAPILKARRESKREGQMSLQNLLGISHSFIVMGTYTSSWKVRIGELCVDEEMDMLVARNGWQAWDIPSYI